KYTVGSGVGCRCGADRASRDSFGNQAASDAAEIVAIEKIGARILAERQDGGRGAGLWRHFLGGGIAAPEIGIALVERPPVRWREKLLWPPFVTQIGHQPDDRFAVAPCARAEGVAGGDAEG